MRGAAPRVRWPIGSDVDGWSHLANIALQLETEQADLEESAQWAVTIRDIVELRLDREAFVAAHLAALRERHRRRKLVQKNLRYKYGFREGSRARTLALVRLDVKRYLRGREH